MKERYYYIEAFIQGHQQFQIYDKQLDSNRGAGFIFDLRVYKTEASAKVALDSLKKEYGIKDGGRNMAHIKSAEMPQGFIIKNNRLKKA